MRTFETMKTAPTSEHAYVQPQARPAHNPVKHHTHVQQVAAGIPVYRGGDVMALDRGTLAKIDRSILSELDHGQGGPVGQGSALAGGVVDVATVLRMPLGVTMGAGIAGLIAHELGTLVNQDEHHGAVFAQEMQRQLVARSAALDVRERRLDEREQSLQASERLLRARTRPLELPRTTERRSQ